MKQPENIREVAALQPDYMGFIFYEKTPRFFEGDIPKTSSAIKKTGVFVDATSAYILEKVRLYELNAIQLHGSESPEFCEKLKEELSEKTELIKVFSVKDSFDFKKLADYEGIVDFFLFDTKGKTKGGTGKTFNWEVLKAYPSTTPFFLSGGIGLEEINTVRELQQYFQQNNKQNLLYAVDINSRFENKPGIKDVEKLKKFLSHTQE